jgi:1,4-alpha-glucan branching enzyme
MGGDEPLAMDYFAGALQATKGGHKVVYHESHDEAGNGKLTDRTIRVAVNGAPLIGETRRYAEARCRFAAGVTLLSAGVPMFLFGEEVGAEKKFLYNHVLENREDMEGMREGSGKKLFAFYADLIRFRRNHAGLRSPDIDVIFVHNEHRLLMFRRWGAGEEFLVLASLNNQAFDNPHYEFRSDGIPAGEWIEIFNSDSGKYGGDNIGNYGATIEAQPGFLACIAPANSVAVFQRNG